MDGWGYGGPGGFHEWDDPTKVPYGWEGPINDPQEGVRPNDYPSREAYQGALDVRRIAQLDQEAWDSAPRTRSSAPSQRTYRTADQERLFEEARAKELRLDPDEPVPIPSYTGQVQKAMSIMGRNFIGPAAVHGRFDIPFLRRHQPFLGTVPFSMNTLRRSRRSHLLVWMAQLSIADVHERYPSLFDITETNGTWFLEDGEDFALDIAPAGWFLLSKHISTETFSKTLSEQLTGAPSIVGSCVPSANIVVQAITTYYLERGGWLLEEEWGRTNDEDSYSEPVVVGTNKQPRPGVSITTQHEDERDKDVGLLTCYTPSKEPYLSEVDAGEWFSLHANL